MRTITTLFAALTLFCSTAAADTTDAASLVMKDDAGIIALTWDGATATAYRGTTVVAEAAADSWDSALWSIQLSAEGQARAPHSFTRVVTPDELERFATCEWTSTAPVSCGPDSGCDCGTPKAVATR